jgi:[NiFe] hydrogenase assembly HybE family chaperone
VIQEAISRNLETVFTEINRSRMADIPIINPVIQVQALGFQPWQGMWLGVLITPWFMNLMLLPTEQQALELPSGCKLLHTFPSGNYEFIVGYEEGIGYYQACSIFSPMFQFADHATAVAAAEAGLQALLAEEPVNKSSKRQAGQTMSRREFLRAPLDRQSQGIGE